MDSDGPRSVDSFLVNGRNFWEPCRNEPVSHTDVGFVGDAWGVDLRNRDSHSFEPQHQRCGPVNFVSDACTGMTGRDGGCYDSINTTADLHGSNGSNQFLR